MAAAIVVWLFGAVITFLVLHAVIRGAINDSRLKSLDDEFGATRELMQRQHAELMQQLKELQQTIGEKGQNLPPPPH